MRVFFATGVILAVLGIGILVFEGINYTDTETVLDVGPVEAQVEQQKTVELSPMVGGAMALVGVGLIGFAVSRNRG